MTHPARIQEIHQALVIHFTSNTYNFVQYNGKLKVKKATPFSEKLARKFPEEYDAISFFVANQMNFFKEHQKVNTFIGNFCNQGSLDLHDKSRGYSENFQYYLTSEAKVLISLGEKIKDFHEICNLLYNDKISLKTMTNFLVHLKMQQYWLDENDPLLEQTYMFILKLSDFVLIEKKNFVKAIMKAKQELV